MGPLIPYVEVPELPLSFLTHLPLLDRLFDPRHPPSIKPFGTLVAFGVYLGSVVAMRHARQRGLDEKKMSEVVFWVVGLGFVGGHMLDAVFYHPQHLLQDPLYLFKLWDGLSSYGGFIGAVAGGLLWRWSRKQRVLPYLECVNSAFPLAWVFGRMGCATVHDHPGHLSEAWFAVRWPVPGGPVVQHPFGPLVFIEHTGPWAGRFDLGLIEMVLTIPLAVAFLVLWHRRPVRPLGFYAGWMCIAYAPVRFFLDFLREPEAGGTIAGGDPRYGGLTPAQWACFGLLALGLFMVNMARRAGATGAGGDGTGPITEAPAGSGDAVPSDEPPSSGEAASEAPASQRQ